VPEVGEDETVVEQPADAPREFLPGEVLEAVLGDIEIDKFLQKRPERRLLRLPVVLVDFGDARRAVVP
jgi:hypothetical protein